jgi:hypothetical protein
MSYDRAVELALERKQDPTEYLNWKTREQEPVECGECFHPISDHSKNGCEHDRSIEVEGIQIDGECGCREHAAETDPLQILLRRAYEEANKNATT